MYIILPRKETKKHQEKTSSRRKKKRKKKEKTGLFCQEDIGPSRYKVKYIFNIWHAAASFGEIMSDYEITLREKIGLTCLAVVIVVGTFSILSSCVIVISEIAKEVLQVI